MSVVYDAGVLVAADRGTRSVWVDHRVRLEAGLTPTTTAPVVAQTSRSPRQAQLRRFLRGCEIVDFGSEDAHRVGALLGRIALSDVALSDVALSDVVDAHVVLTASDRSSIILTSDPGDIGRMADAVAPSVKISRV